MLCVINNDVGFNFGDEKARKETAREILKKLYTVLWNEKISIANTFVNLDIEIREIAEEYGVEV